MDIVIVLICHLTPSFVFISCYTCTDLEKVIQSVVASLGEAEKVVQSAIATVASKEGLTDAAKAELTDKLEDKAQDIEEKIKGVYVNCLCSLVWIRNLISLLLLTPYLSTYTDMYPQTKNSC